MMMAKVLLHSETSKTMREKMQECRYNAALLSTSNANPPYLAGEQEGHDC